MTAMTLHSQIRQQLLDNLAQPQPDEAAQLNNSLRLLSKWRSVLIQNTLLQHQGTVVMDGPLKGLDFLPQSAKAAMPPSCSAAMSNRCCPISNKLSRLIIRQFSTSVVLRAIMQWVWLGACPTPVCWPSI